jgi:hypothetical protein
MLTSSIYQGAQHYRKHYLYGGEQQHELRDKLKRQECIRNGITLIEVPYWWDNKLESLQATLHSKRPDLIPMPSNGIPIPDQEPVTSSKIVSRE